LIHTSLHSIIEPSGLWPDFLWAAFKGHLPEAGLRYSSDIAGLKQALQNRKFPSERRALLADVLLQQNKNALNTFPKIKEHLELLRGEDTFTITTGHQLSLAGGPLFLWYKLCTVVAQAAFLSRESRCRVVPVFWMASEDHDLQELNDFSIFGKRINFEPSFQGAAGRLPMEALEQWASEFSAVCGVHEAEFLWKAFLQGANLAEATRNWVNAAFGEYGLLVLDADDARLKQEFLPLALRELESGFAGDAVMKCTQKLVEAGVAAEKDWPVHPRNLNLFWLDDAGRQRLIRHEDGRISKGAEEQPRPLKEWQDLFSAYPECISPNVVMRPLYQELILPNLAYVGGPGECAYWLQLREAFEEANLPYPVLLPRRNFLILKSRQLDSWLSAGFVTDDLLLEADNIRRRVGESGLSDFIQNRVEQDLLQVYEKLSTEVGDIDSTLMATVHAEQQKAIKGIELIRNKLIKSIRNKDEMRLNKLLKITAAVRPDAKPQERAVHLFQFAFLSMKENLSVMMTCCEEPGIKGLYLMLEQANQQS